MKMSSLSLIAAGVLAVAGAAQAADTFDSPTRAGEASTMTMGQPNLVTHNSGVPGTTYTVPNVIVDTTVLGAPPATITWVDPVPVYGTPPLTYLLPAPVVQWNSGMPMPYGAPGSIYYGD